MERRVSEKKTRGPSGYVKRPDVPVIPPFRKHPPFALILRSSDALLIGRAVAKRERKQRRGTCSVLRLNPVRNQRK